MRGPFLGIFAVGCLGGCPASPIGSRLGGTVADEAAQGEGGAGGTPSRPPVVSPRRGENRLADEASPYLRQHADNPVDWYPWGREAVERARREDKPIFLSIGYATCHWCHVMEKESFEDPKVAAFLNERFVSIKVDREEHPDVDAFYIEAVGAMGGSTGWPLNVFLTPDLVPFFGGTYFPPKPAHGRPSFLEVLRAVDEVFRERRTELERQGTKVVDAILQVRRPRHGEVSHAAVERAFARLAGAFDPEYGGFGRRQKFPNAPLLRAEIDAIASESVGPELAGRLAEHVRKTLDELARGGIFDHVGGSFHRYAVDRSWHVPHFEKTLYDNAQLVDVYLRAAWSLGDDGYDGVARRVLDDLLRWRRPHGLVVGLDADDPAGEGAFYTWTPDELTQALGEEDGMFVARLFGVTRRGEPELGGRSVLHRVSAEEASRMLQVAPEGIEARWAALRERLARVRARRPAPAVDDKLLVGWNGLAAAALAEGARLLDDANLAEAAKGVGRFLMTGARHPDGELAHGVVGKRPLGPAYLEDYSLSAYGLLRVHAATGDLDALRTAHDRARGAFDRFWDPEGGAFVRVDRGRIEQEVVPPVVTDPGEDGVLPGGASAAIRVALEAGLLLGDRDLLERGRIALEAHAGAVGDEVFGHGFLLDTLLWWLGPKREVVVAGPGGDPRTRALLDVLSEVPYGQILLARLDGETEPAGMPALAGKVARGGVPTAYVCSYGACDAPTGDPEVLRRQLRKAGLHLRRAGGASPKE